VVSQTCGLHNKTTIEHLIIIIIIIIITIIIIIIKVKQFRYRHGVAQRVPGS
jgi:hypothetical protein